MDKLFGDGIKKFLLMGIGAAAMTVEKSQQMVDELVKKGERLRKRKKLSLRRRKSASKRRSR